VRVSFISHFNKRLFWGSSTTHAHTEVWRTVAPFYAGGAGLQETDTPVQVQHSRRITAEW